MVINKKKWFIGIMGVAVLISAIPFWFFFVIPHLFTLQKDFVYEAEVVSSDNFYDQAKGAFSGESISATKFSYSVVGQQNGVLIIKNIFDVHKLTGEPIFSVERLYGIDPITKKHVTGFGDKNRDGYLFGPKDLKKGEPFTYWHINYDGPAHMRFVGEETINGLTVYRYETHYEGVNIDQTKNLTNLPDVGITTGIDLDPYLQLWIEPQTGTLINYKDETTAYYYDLTTGKRLYPWNKFSNTFKNSSITTQVEIAKQKKLFIFVINFGALIAIILFAFIVFLTWSLRRLYTTKKDVVKNLKKLEEQQVKLQSEEVKLKNATTIASVQNTQLKETVVELEKSKKAIINILEDLQVERENLNQAKAKDEAILSSIGDGVIVTDKEGVVILMNRAAEVLFGRRGTEFLGKKLYETLDIYDQEGVVVPFEERPLYIALTTGKSTTTTTTTTATYSFEKKDRTKFPAAITITPVILDNAIVGAVEVFRDITKEKDIDKAKTEFVSLASHQLRTPLTDVSWHTEMILKGDLGKVVPKQKKYLEAIYQGNKRMIELVNTLLDVSRLELGTFKVTPSPTDVIALAQSVLDEQKSEIENKKLVIVEKLNKDVPTFSTDPKLLRMVFQNLLANSVAYTPENGKVRFEIALDTTKENILITVADTGYGIPKSQQYKIFTKFFRADNIREKDTEGTGLGLYIIKSIVENSGGKIRFESEENKGSTFYVTLPLSGIKNKESSKKLS